MIYAGKAFISNLYLKTNVTVVQISELEFDTGLKIQTPHTFSLHSACIKFMLQQSRQYTDVVTVSLA